MSAVGDARKRLAETDDPCRCLHQMPHLRGEVGGPIACRHALADKDTALLRAVRPHCADTKEKRDWPEIADKQAHKITQAVLRSDWLADLLAEARAEALDAVLRRADDGIEFGPHNTILLHRIVREVRSRIARTEVGS